ncbi:hypothetical protein C2S51_021157 [Perilla frutescens var. frutescens]|nr:hypothetical protein C2S51_021157 [Perilla frutescens var. frutescens]
MIHPFEILAMTRQTTTIDVYVNLFIARLVPLLELPDVYALCLFLSGLSDDIRLRLHKRDTLTLASTMTLACEIDHEVRGLWDFQSQPILARSSQPLSFLSPSSHGQHVPRASRANSVMGSQTLLGSNSSVLAPSQLPLRTAMPLRPAPSYRTRGPTLVELDDCLQLEDSLSLDYLELSTLSARDLDGPRMLKLSGTIGATKLVMIVDSGTSHNFISAQTATRLNLMISSTAPYFVRLGDGNLVSAQGVYTVLPLILGDATFVLNAHVFPLRGVDIILGVSWLATLGDVLEMRAKLVGE